MTTPLDRKARDLEAARRCIDKLDRNASLDYDDAIPPTHITIEELLHNCATWISKAYGEHYGPGSWTASHQLRSLELRDIKPMLIAWGASPFLIEQWGEDLLQRVRSASFRGGVIR